MALDVRESKVVEKTGLLEEELLQRKRAEEALRESRATYKELADSIADVFFAMDEELRYTFWNKASEDLTGIPAEDAIGKSLYDLFPDTPQTRRAEKIYLDVLRTQEPQTFVNEYQLGGKDFVFEISAYPSRDGLSVFVKDITERKRAEEELRESEEKYRTILENIEDGYFEVDIAGNFTSFNDALCRIFGYPEDELMGMNNRHYMDEETAKAVYRTFNAVYRTGKPTKLFDYEIIRKDGTRRSVEVSVSLVNDTAGEPVGFRGILRDITERKRAEEEIRRRSEELATLYDVSLDVAAQLETEQLLQTIVEQATRLLKAKAGAIYLYDPVKREIELQVSYGLSKDYGGTRLALGEGVSGRVAEARGPLMVDDYQRWEGRSPLWEGEAIGGVLGVPLKRGDDLLGVLTIDHAPGNTFQEGDSRLVTLFASQAAIAIENARLYEELRGELTERKRAEEGIRRRSEELTVLNNIGMAVTGTLDLQEVLQTIQKRTRELLGEKYGPVFALFNERDQTFEVTLTHVQEDVVRRVDRFIGTKFEELSLPLSSLKPALREALSAGRSYVAHDVRDFFARGTRRRLFKGAQIAMGVKCIAALPLWAKGKLVGTMLLFSQKEKIPEEDMELLSGVASQAAIAIENARLYEEAQARSTYLATLQRINVTLRSTLPLREVLDTIVRATTEALGYVGSFIAIPDATGERLTLGAAWGGRVADAALRVMRFRLESFSVPVKVEENLIARAFVTGELQLSTGEPEGIAVGVEPPISTRMARAIERTAGAKLAACVPLRVAERVVGVLIVLSPREQLPDEERAMLLGLADQAGLAIENARLYEERRRKAEELAVLNEIGRAVSSVMRLDDLLELICQEASRVIDTSSLYIALYDAQKKEISFPLYFEEGHRRIPEKRPAKRGITEYVINSAKPLMINHDLVSRLKELDIELIGRPSKSWLSVPILTEDRVIGVLAIQDYQKENAYDESHLRLLSTIANQAAIAIENAHLYEGERRKTTHLAVINEVSRKAISILDLDEMLEEVARSICSGFDYYNVALFLVDKERHEAAMEAVAGGFEHIAPGKYRQPLDQGIIGLVIRTGRSWLANDVSQDPCYTRGFPEEVLTKSELCVPIQLGGEVIGALDIQSINLNAFDETDVTAMETLSGQIAIAIENARLYEHARQRTSELSTLDLVGLTLASTRDLPAVLDLVVESCQQLIGTPGVHIFLYDEISGEFTHGAGQWDRKEKEPAMRLPRAGGASDTVAKRGKPLVINDARNHPLYSSPDAQSWEIDAVAGFPLKGAEAVLGVLYVVFFTPHTFVEDELKVLSLLANLATAAIENARSYERLKEQNLHAISALAAAVEAKDPYTGGHSEKVTQFAVAIGKKMGLSNDEIEDLQVAALLHDIGKIGIPDGVLNKPARLTSAEFLVIKAHSVIAAEIVGKIKALAHLVPIIRHHHERWDGTGYPGGLKGEEIPLLARILAVADGYDAMTSERPYRGALTEEETLAELEKGAGSQWDPQVVEVFVKHLKKKP